MGIVSYIFGLMAVMLSAFSGNEAFTPLASPYHEFYISNNDIIFNEENQSLEITLMVFTDDLETVLAPDVGSGGLIANAEDPKTNKSLEFYLKNNLSLEINGKIADPHYIGMEPEDEVTRCYLEVTEITEIKAMRVTNKVLMDLHEDQKNIVYIKIGSKKHSLLCEKDSHTQDLSL